MQNLSPRYLTLALGVPALALASLWVGSTAASAATQAAAQPVTDPSEPILVANIFRQIGDAVRGITETVNTVDSLLQQVTGSGNSNNPSPQPQAAPPSAVPSAGPVPGASPPAPSTTAQASDDLQIIHHDNRPTNCHTQGSNPLQCEAFRMTMMPSEGALIFSYYFDNQPFSFVTTTASEFQMDSGMSYRVVGLMYNGETVEKEGVCGVTRIGGQYRAAICSTRDGSIEFIYTNLN